MTRPSPDDPGGLLEKAVDEAMSPVVDELWHPILPAVRAELDEAARAAKPYRPTAEDIIARMRANGLHDPTSPDRS